MKTLIQELLKIANTLDKHGFSKTAARLDKVAEEMEPRAVRTLKDDLSVRSQGMLEVQRLFNKYVRLAEIANGEVYTDINDLIFQPAVPENGRVGNKTTWTAITLQFDWKPGVGYKSYKQLASMLRKEIDKLNYVSSSKLSASEEKALQDWEALIDMEYDAADAAKYKVTSFEGLLEKLQNLPQQRGEPDALHRQAGWLAALAKDISAGVQKVTTLVDWLDSFITDIKDTAEKE